MNKLSALILGLGLLCFFVHEVAFSMDDPSAWLKSTPKLFCPGTSLAMTCGNKVCEESQGENWKNCSYDCVKAPLVSYNGETVCGKVQKVLIPKNAREVQDMVYEALESGYRIRVTGKAHTINSQICTDGVVISTEKLTRIYKLETHKGKTTVHVQAGVTLGQLTSWLHIYGKSLGYAIMGGKDMTVAGAIATGSHGSSTRETSTISSLVESLTMVTPQGELVEYSAANTDADMWRALRANMGMLGVVVELRLKVRSQFNLHTRITYMKARKLFKKDGLKNLIVGCDHARIHWFPHDGNMMHVCALETTAPAAQENQSTSINISSFMEEPLKYVVHKAACNNGLNCLLEDSLYNYMKLVPPLLKKKANGKIVHTSEVTGHSHNILSTGFPDIKKQFFQTDWEIAVPLCKADETLKMLKEFFKEKKLCLPFMGVSMRFVPIESTTLLAHTAAGHDFKEGDLAVTFEIIGYNPVGFSPEREANYQKKFEDFAGLLIHDFGGRGHLAKNRDWVFALEYQLGNYGDNRERFQSVLSKVDPNGVFANDFSANFGFHPRKVPGIIWDSVIPK